MAQVGSHHPCRVPPGSLGHLLACWILDGGQESLEQRWLRNHLAPTWRRKTQFWCLGHQPIKRHSDLLPICLRHLAGPLVPTAILLWRLPLSLGSLFASRGEDAQGTAIYPNLFIM